MDWNNESTSQLCLWCNDETEKIPFSAATFLRRVWPKSVKDVFYYQWPPTIDMGLFYLQEEDGGGKGERSTGVEGAGRCEAEGSSELS